MTTKNPSNPYSSDANHTSKEVQMPISKARVVDVKDSVDNGFHTVRIKVYGDGTSYVAPVITPVIGSVVVPKKGDDVAVVFDSADDAWVIGSWYAVDRVDNDDINLPEYEEGDVRIGNDSGSHITIKNNGDILIDSNNNSDVIIDGVVQ